MFGDPESQMMPMNQLNDPADDDHDAFQFWNIKLIVNKIIK